MNKIVISILFFVGGVALILAAIRFPEKDKYSKHIDYSSIVYGIILILASFVYYLNE